VAPRKECRAVLGETEFGAAVADGAADRQRTGRQVNGHIVPSVTSPVPRFRLFVPVKVNRVQAWGCCWTVVAAPTYWLRVNGTSLARFDRQRPGPNAQGLPMFLRHCPCRDLSVMLHRTYGARQLRCHHKDVVTTTRGGPHRRCCPEVRGAGGRRERPPPTSLHARAEIDGTG